MASGLEPMTDPRALQIHPDGSCYMQQNRISGCAAWVVFPECTNQYSGNFFAYAGPSLAVDLHRGNGYRVRFNSNPSFPQILERIEDVPLPKPVRSKKSKNP
jgi:hypothetical protein